jgi:pimeloyl-ACP methyl ester carboxylesterase
MDGLLAILQQAADEPPVDLSRITQPVLILNGADDRIVRSTVSQRVGERLPHARTVVVDQAGHMLLEEQPEECARAIGDFLREAHAGLEQPAARTV